MRNEECGMWNVECGMRNVECGMRNVECGMWNAECGMWKGYSLFIRLTTFKTVQKKQKERM